VAEQRALLQAILDQAVDGIIASDTQGDFTYVNDWRA
jgi:PAS domain-containing protein